MYLLEFLWVAALLPLGHSSFVPFLPPGLPHWRWFRGIQDLEHLYYGRPLPLEDDLTYVARANVAAPFDPQPVSAAEALGLRELNDLTVGDQSQLAERWRSFSSQRGSEVGPDGVPLKPRCVGKGGRWRS